MAYQSVNRAGVAIIGFVVTHKGDAANGSVSDRNFVNRVSARGPGIYLNPLNVLFCIASDASSFYRRKPFGISLGELNCNPQVIVSVGCLSIVAKPYQTLDLVFCQIDIGLKTAVRQAVCAEKLHDAWDRSAGFDIGLGRFIKT